MAYEQWTVNGYDLSSLAHDIQTYDGLDDVPDMAGEDINRMQDHGIDPGVYYFGPSRKTVAMVINTVNADGTTASTPDAMRAIYDANLDKLLRVFYRRQLLNVQRTMADGTIKNGYCRVISGIQPKRLGLSAGLVAFDLQLPYSFWYGNTDISATVSNGASNFALTDFASSTAPLNELSYQIVGPASNPIITDPETGSTVQVNGSIASGTSVTLVNADQSVTGTALSNVVHTGDPKWLTLYPTPDGPLVTFNGGNSAAKLVITGREKWLR